MEQATARQRKSGGLQVPCGASAAGLCVAAALVGGARLDGYSHALHPLAMPGATGIPGATVFNACAFVVPGMLAAVVALALYRMLPAAAGWLPRIGARMVLLSALAFAAQGLFPLDLADLDGPVNGLHASAWLAWWIAFVAGAPLLASGLPRIRIPTAAAVGALLATMFVPPLLLAPPLAQRIALTAWLLWLIVAPWQASRAGSPKPKTPA